MTCEGKQVVWNTRPRHHGEAEMSRAQTASTEMEFMWHLNTSHGWPQGRVCASLSGKAADNIRLIPVHFCPLLAWFGRFGRSPLAPWLIRLWVSASHAWLLLQQVGMSSKTGLGSAYNLIDIQRCFTTEMSPKCVDSVRVASGRYQMEAIFIWMKAVAKCDVKLEKPKSFCTCNITVLEQALVCSWYVVLLRDVTPPESVRWYCLLDDS